jgi:hypothetical protein
MPTIDPSIEHFAKIRAMNPTGRTLTSEIRADETKHRDDRDGEAQDVEPPSVTLTGKMSFRGETRP